MIRATFANRSIQIHNLHDVEVPKEQGPAAARYGATVLLSLCGSTCHETELAARPHGLSFRYPHEDGLAQDDSGQPARRHSSCRFPRQLNGRDCRNRPCGAEGWQGLVRQVEYQTGENR